jgi:Haem-degrading
MRQLFAAMLVVTVSAPAQRAAAQSDERALPIIRGGYVVGAVAGSGATGQQDEQIAAAGLAGLP